MARCVTYCDAGIWSLAGKSGHGADTANRLLLTDAVEKVFLHRGSKFLLAVRAIFV
jgi:hypothetical protein